MICYLYTLTSLVIFRELPEMPLHVCFVFNRFPPLSMGGVERYLLNISKGLKKYNELREKNTKVSLAFPSLTTLLNKNIEKKIEDLIIE